MSRTAAAAAFVEPEYAFGRRSSGVEIASSPLQGVDEGPNAVATATARVFVVDRRPLVRSGLASLTRRAFDCEVLALDDVALALADVALVRTPPRLVLVGIQAGDDPEALIVAAREVGAPVVCLIDGHDPALTRDALAAGADGYLMLGGLATETLRAGIGRIEAGERVIPAELPELASGDAGAPRAVTDRCLEVLRWLAEGLHDEEIADQLQISTSSVRKHIASAQERLQARTRTQVVAVATRNGLL